MFSSQRKWLRRILYAICWLWAYIKFSSIIHKEIMVNEWRFYAPLIHRYPLSTQPAKMPAIAQQQIRKEITFYESLKTIGFREVMFEYMFNGLNTRLELKLTSQQFIYDNFHSLIIACQSYYVWSYAYKKRKWQAKLNLFSQNLKEHKRTELNTSEQMNWNIL